MSRVRVDRLAEQARRIVAAAGKLARQHRLGLGDAGPDQHLARGEQVGDRGRIVAALRRAMRNRARASACRPGELSPLVGIGGDDVAEQGQRRLGPPGAGIIARQPPLGVEQGRRARDNWPRAGRSPSRCWRSASARSPRASAMPASSPWICALSQSVAAIRPPRIATSSLERPVERRGRLGVAPLQAEDRAAQLQRLAVEDLRLVLLGQPVLAAQPARARRFGAEPARGRPVDDQARAPPRSTPIGGTGRSSSATAAPARPWLSRCMAR